jgi:YidC/Oxa1 family membrane protein insertase
VDKKTIILVIALGLLVVFWAPIMTTLGLLKPAPPRPKATPTESQQTAPETKTDIVPVSTPTQSAPVDTTAGPAYAIQPSDLPYDTIVVETDVWLVTMTNYGGAPISIKLKKFNYHENGSVELLPGEMQTTPELLFNGGTINANDFVYQSSLPKGNYTVTGDPLEIAFTFARDSGGTITKIYRFYKSRYDYELKVVLDGRGKLGFERDYAIEWNVPLRPTELDIQADYNAMWALAYQGKTRVKFDDYTDNKYNASFTGNTNWIAARSKYFTTIMIPRSQEGAGAKSAGVKTSESLPGGSSVIAHKITTGLMMNLPSAEMVTDSFTIFAGPIDYDLLSSYNNEVVDIIDIGTTPFVGWIVKLFAIPIMWIMPKMYAVIPNYGFVIIIFALIIKVLTWPLSKKTAQSMAAMKEIQPRLEELKKKHKNNPQALNREMMKLYKDMGINPFSGCLPYLPQLPLFIALYAVFSATILLRQAPFIFWYDDLSRGALSFTDPYIVMVIIMMVLMFVQQKMTMTDPKNKILIYIMPLFMGLVFYRASAGLVLYWTCFSLFSFIEQLIFKPKITLPSGPIS